MRSTVPIRVQVPVSLHIHRAGSGGPEQGTILASERTMQPDVFDIDGCLERGPGELGVEPQRKWVMVADVIGGRSRNLGGSRLGVPDVIFVHHPNGGCLGQDGCSQQNHQQGFTHQRLLFTTIHPDGLHHDGTEVYPTLPLRARLP